MAESLLATGGASPSPWWALALDSTAASRDVVDELLARVARLRTTLPDLIPAALIASAKRPNVALHLLSKHWQGREVDPEPLLVGPSDDVGAAPLWAVLALGETNAALADHLIGRVPRLKATVPDLLMTALRDRKYDAVRRFVANGALLHARFGAEVVPMLLDRSTAVPESLLRHSKERANEDLEATFFSKLSPSHLAAFRREQSPWTLLLLDEANQSLADEMAAQHAALQAAMLQPEMLLLTMVPRKAAQASWLISKGGQLDSGVLAVLLEPATNGVSGWQRLQLDTDSRRSAPLPNILACPSTNRTRFGIARHPKSAIAHVADAHHSGLDAGSSTGSCSRHPR